MGKQRRKKKGIHVFWYIWLCAVTFVLLNNLTQSEFISGTKNSIGTAEVAKPIVTITKTSTNDVNNTSARREITFTVQNYDLSDETKINEVNMKYYLDISKKTNLPVTYKLYKIINGVNKQEVTLTNNKTPDYIMPHTVKAQDSYILELTFTSPPSNSDIQNAVTITLNSEQA